MFGAADAKISIDALLTGEHGKSRWKPALSNEWGRLTQSNDADVEATDTIKFVPFQDVSTDNKVTYASFVCNHRPQKDEEWCIQLAVGDDCLEYDSDSGSPATDLTKIKLLLNSILFDTKKRCAFFQHGFKRHVSSYSNGKA